MPTNLSLDVIDIPRPCPADWDAMRGDAQSRFCDHCQHHVYNLSEMTRAAAEALIIEKQGKLCGRLYRRADGTIITADCGGGWKLRARKLGALVGAACAAVISGVCAPYVFSRNAVESGQAMDAAPPARLVERVILKLKGAPPTPPVTPFTAVAGFVVVSPRNSPTPPPTPMPQIADPAKDRWFENVEKDLPTN